MGRLYYQRKTAGDVLFLVNVPDAYPDRVITKGNVVALYQGETLVGVNFLEFSTRVKIHVDGMIPTPQDALIDVLNAELENADLPKLDYVRSSGYRVGRVERKEEHPLDEKLSILTLVAGDDRYETVTRYQNLEVGSLAVMCLDGTLRHDGTMFHKRVERNIPIDVEICSAADLRLGEEFKTAFAPKLSKEGEDFYYGIE